MTDKEGNKNPQLSQPSQPGPGYVPLTSQPTVGFVQPSQMEMPPPYSPYGSAGYSTSPPPPPGFKPYDPRASPEHSVNTEPSEENIQDTAYLNSWNGFTEKAVRQAFVRKVFAILTVQLTFTVGVIALFVFEKHVKHFVQSSPGVYMSAYIVFLVLYIVLVCCPGVRRQYPVNIILLSIFTVVLSYVLGCISSFYDIDSVFISIGICAACCFAVTVFSFNTKFDFTSCYGFLFVAVWVLFLFGIVTIFTHDRIMNTVYAALGALLFMVFLAFDIQLILGGRKLELSPEEHIFAALQLYMDIVRIFLFILSLVGGGRK